jgi:hypothetical protein
MLAGDARSMMAMAQ